MKKNPVVKLQIGNISGNQKGAGVLLLRLFVLGGWRMWSVFQ
jgi:hypothetical protein